LVWWISIVWASIIGSSALYAYSSLGKLNDIIFYLKIPPKVNKNQILESIFLRDFIND
jgi:hypothetical protein